MNPSKLDRRVSFERCSLTDDGFADTKVWSTHGNAVWASKQDISDGEKMQGGGVTASLTARFVVRSSVFTCDLTPKDRIICKGVAFNIFGIKEIGRDDLLEITAAARADQ